MGKLTPKQEAFCRAYVETGNASQAYRDCYDVSEDIKRESVWSMASRLMARPEIIDAIEAMHEKARASCMVSIGTLTRELEEARTGAISKEQYAAAVSATNSKAKLHNLTPDRLEVTGKDGEAIKTEDVTGYDLARRLAFILGQNAKRS